MTPRREEPAQDELLARYRQASLLDEARPGAMVREAVLAHARTVAAAQARESDTAPGQRPGLTEQARQREASNQPDWRLQALGGLALMGFIGLLFMQFELGTPEEREIALGSGSRQAVVPAPRPAPEAAAPVAPVAAAAPARDAASVRPPATPAQTSLPPAATAAKAGPVRSAPAPRPAQPAPAAPTVANDAALAGTRGEAGAVADAAPLAKSQSTLPDPAQPRSPEPLRSAAEQRELAPAPPSPSPSPSPAQVFGQARPLRPATTAAADAAGSTAAPQAALRRALPAPGGLGQALRQAAQRGDLAGIEALLQQGAPLEASNEAGQNALLLAVMSRQPAAVARLLAAGANPQAADRDGVSALRHAQNRALPEIEALLRQHGARP